VLTKVLTAANEVDHPFYKVYNDTRLMELTRCFLSLSNISTNRYIACFDNKICGSVPVCSSFLVQLKIQVADSNGPRIE